VASLRLVAHGGASRQVIWERYADPRRWHEWAPQIRSEAEGRWSWNATVGPARLRVDHEVDEGMAALVLHGPPLMVAAYAPIARFSLQRLVRDESVA
jgi:hypothetical protein